MRVGVVTVFFSHKMTQKRKYVKSFKKQMLIWKKKDRGKQPIKGTRISKKKKKEEKIKMWSLLNQMIIHN